MGPVGERARSSITELRAERRDCAADDPWQQQPVRLAVWSEKSVGGTLAPVLDGFLVPFQVHYGNTSTTMIHRTAASTRRAPRALVILYVNDHWHPPDLFGAVYSTF